MEENEEGCLRNSNHSADALLINCDKLLAISESLANPNVFAYTFFDSSFASALNHKYRSNCKLHCYF